ncbi:MAG: benzoyl-CoA reductase subunit D [Acidobacteria bacterium]|nr:benzoyl-CoA reductase subunit D [Acidobacteriota bacterium]
MTLAAGIDVGTSAVKCAVVAAGPGGAKILGTSEGRIRRRDTRAVVALVWEEALRAAEVSADRIAYVATTGEGEIVEFRRGHFYSMTAHARGALHLAGGARAALDMGALHARAIRIDGRGRVLDYRMTSQCASGSGQFLENIARYLGVTLDEVGRLSTTAAKPERVSGVCAVLAETDVINMASRGIATADILKGIHLSMAGRFARLLGAAGISGEVLATGGLAADVGLVAALREEIASQKLSITIAAHPQSAHAGAIGAAIWGAWRHERLKESA